MSSVALLGGIFLFLAIPLIVGLIVLQVFLCKRENKGLGLILPIVFLVLSLILVLSSILLTGGASWGNLLWLLLCNIPTIIFGIIYLAHKDNNEKDKQKKQLDRMSIQDLD